MMWKLVITDYFKAFNWEKMKEKRVGLMIVYFTSLMPLSCGAYLKVESAIQYYLFVLPVAFAILSSSIHHMGLPKMMHLCPINKETKREYVLKAMIFRIVFTSLLGGILLLVLSCVFIKDWIWGGILIYNHISLCILLCGFDGNYLTNGNSSNKSRESSGTKENRSMNRNIMTTVDFLLISMSDFFIFILLVVAEGLNEAWWLKCILAGGVILLQIPLTICFLSTWKEEVEKAIDYEKSSQIYEKALAK